METLRLGTFFWLQYVHTRYLIVTRSVMLLQQKVGVVLFVPRPDATYFKVFFS